MNQIIEKETSLVLSAVQFMAVRIFNIITLGKISAAVRTEKALKAEFQELKKNRNKI
ncbi:hypothetical protein [Corticicoccus populi]|uniref:Uncharacterized protein n=1 Tax=Corticicoccus populi TaxID=1812821 RepID=A0ABW5WWB2_9STAP